MDVLTQIAAAAERLKIFPLPSVVLFPGTAVPLHIFEPRYHALVKDCLEGDRVIGLAQLLPGWESDYKGRPSLMPIFCAGVIHWSEALGDGRYNILVRGVCRARVLSEWPPEKPYREVRAEILPDKPYTEAEEALLRSAVLDLAGRLPEQTAAQLLEAVKGDNAGELADRIAGLAVEDMNERQALLNDLDVGSRLRRLNRWIGDFLARVGGSNPNRWRN